ncbi:MAG TPA: YqgE/AlgH family protein [Bryobacteraceae bacterium]|jgi:putative transcriptional regulator|nr:YqgE/AlgH family protein [Bryobacteraceae bacterium]
MAVRRAGILVLAAGLLLPGPFCAAQSTQEKDLGLGKILIMQRNVPDPHFAHSVILLAKFDRTGSLGLMLHYRSDMSIRKALAGMKGAENRTDTLFVGGPVEMQGVLALLRSDVPPEDASHVAGKLYLLTSKQSISAALADKKRKPGDLHVYLGYTGWAAGQLEREVRLNGWYIFDYDQSLVFDEHPETLWDRLIARTELQKVLFRLPPPR